MGTACSGEGGEVALGRLAGPWGALGVLGQGAVLAMVLGCAWGAFAPACANPGRVAKLVSALACGFPCDTCSGVTPKCPSITESAEHPPCWMSLVVQVSSRDSSPGCDKGHPLVTKPTELQPQRQPRCCKVV